MKSIDILNERLNEMKELYCVKLGELIDINEDFHRKIELLNEVNDPDKFKFSDMNAVGFLKKLSKIEQDPYSLWDAVNTVYGEGFFTKIIEKEYGVNSTTFVSMNERITKKTAEIKLKYETEQAQLKRQLETKIGEMQASLNAKQLELVMIKETWERDEIAIKSALTQEIRNEFEQELAVRFKEKDDQMTELYQQINELDEAVEQYKKITMNYYEACEDDNWDAMKRINKEIVEIAANNEFLKQVLEELNAKKNQNEGEEEGEGEENLRNIIKRSSTINIQNNRNNDEIIQTDIQLFNFECSSKEVQTDKIEILTDNTSKENQQSEKKTKFKTKRLSNKRGSGLNSERDSKKLMSSVEDSNVRSTDRLEDEFEQNSSYLTKPVNKSLIGEAHENEEENDMGQTKSKRVCHSSYTRRGKRLKGKEKSNEFQISYYDLPKVFSRLWIDAENKNERLREIQVKRINRSKEELELIRNPHPLDHSSPHINVEDLKDSDLVHRKTMENQIIQNIINQNLLNHGYLYRNDVRSGDNIYPNLLSNIASKTKDIIKREDDEVESQLAFRENKYEQRRMSGPNNQNDSQMSAECQDKYHSSIKGIISATCKFSKHRNKSVDKQRGPAIKRSANFLREIKVIPYNISTIENLITK